MGNTTSRNVTIPEYNRYTISYCKQKNYSEEILIKESIDLSLMIPQTIKDSTDIIYFVILNEINKQGYSLKPGTFYFDKWQSINEMIDNCKSFSSSDFTDVLDDLVIVKNCYVSTMDNIKKVLSSKKIIIAGIIVDTDLVKSLTDEYQEIKQVTDIICIHGYTSEGDLLIKTSWKNESITLNKSFIENIKEIWTIEIKTPF